MNQTDLTIFKQAVTQAQTGQKQAAYAQLKPLEGANPTEPNLMLWLAFTAPDLAQAEAYLNRVITLDPHNPALATARTWLAAEKARQPVATSSIHLEAATTGQPIRTEMAATPPVRSIKAGKRRRRLFLYGGAFVVMLLIVLAIAFFPRFNQETVVPNRVYNSSLELYQGANTADRVKVIYAIENPPIIRAALPITVNQKTVEIVYLFPLAAQQKQIKGKNTLVGIVLEKSERQLVVEIENIET